MNNTTRHTMTLIAFSVMAACAHAADPAPVTDIGTVSANGNDDTTNAPARKKAVTPAAAAALTQAPLDAQSPQTQIGSNYIHDQLTPVADYGSMIRIAPSYSSSSPNGTGLSEAKNQTLRGFPDGQFNVTYDGLPFGDTNDFTHHTTSYFPSATIGSISIDRSPGDATQLGYATFGGSVNMFSPKLSPTSLFSFGQTLGSHYTSQTDIGYTTGAVQSLGDNNLMINAHYLGSDGALTNGDVRDANIYLKDQLPLGENTLLTFVYTFNRINFNNPDGTTLNDANKYGYNYGLSKDPTRADYIGYNYQDKDTDFAYVGLDHDFGNGWTANNKLYTYYYNNVSHELNGDTTSSPLSAVKTAKPYTTGQSGTDIAGAIKINQYRTWGDALTTEHADATGTFTGGLWLEHTWNNRNRNAVDFTTGTPYNQNATYGPTFYDMKDMVDTRQLFAQYDWKALSNLTVSPGLRYQNFERTLNARINQNNLPGTNGEIDKTWDSVLPSLSANYRFTPLWSGYVEVSKGTLAPNLNTLYSGNPLSNNSVDPQSSIAYQIGTVLKAERYTFNIDAYLIDFSNYLSKTGSGQNATYFNSGGVRYTGVEAEGNVLLGYGFGVYGNGSVNHATFTEDGVGSQAWKSGQTISFVPQYTAALSLNYDQSVYHAALATKFIGAMYQGSNGEADGSLYRVPAYHVTDLTLARDLTDLGTRFKNLRLTFGVSNLFNTNAITDNMGPAASDTSHGTDPNQFLYYFVPERSYFVSLRGDI
ncbi:iron complex outermembrane receptor protein [Silvimonas terrae]|uniref:Iron complex outermembrane receptor protein n=1 Tax=Silvimonas terrae TaxID=300266 RepID=A0A840RMC8_9NEIS|nr:TonB-dependent receptor [Silvimonas terrae]MBB5193678.1 iron complex outermembrane receptor protein [Silvimonas terrae]